MYGTLFSVQSSVLHHSQVGNACAARTHLQTSNVRICFTYSQVSCTLLYVQSSVLHHNQVGNACAAHIHLQTSCVGLHSFKVSITSRLAAHTRPTFISRHTANSAKNEPQSNGPHYKSPMEERERMSFNQTSLTSNS
eukprot:1161222-Pelagomonas_calceolata.AAC.8